MALISMRQLLDHAAENDYGVSAFNINNLERMRAIMEGAQETNSPVIMQASAGARKYAGPNFLRYLMLAAVEEFPHIPVVMYQDHGACKFSRPPSGDILAIDRIKAIHERLPNAHLVMYGSSSAHQDLLKEMNECGGEIADTCGVPVQEIQRGIKHGVRKVNIDTDLRLASTAAIRRSLAENPAEFDPRKYLAVSQKVMKDVVVASYEAFDTAGNADKTHAKSLESMFMHYAAGELTPLIA